MELLKDLHPVTLALIVLALLLLLGGLGKLLLWFIKNTGDKLVAEVKKEFDQLNENFDSLNRKVELGNIKTIAIHETLGKLFNGKYEELYNDVKSKLIAEAEFLKP